MNGKRVLAWLMVLSSIFAAAPAFANSVFLFHFGGKDLYDIVIEDPKGESTLAPGIYKIDGKTGNSSLVLKGQVLGVNRSYKGILTYAAQSTATESAHDVLSIVDGRVVLLNHNSNTRNETSVLTLGEKGKAGFQAFDIVTGLTVEIPKITSMDDVRIAEGPKIAPSAKFPNGGTLFLLSIKAPSPIGNGLTLGFIVEGTGSQKAKPTVHEAKAWVLGYNFADTAGLKRMLPWNNAMPNPAGGDPVIPVYAPNVIAKFKTQISKIRKSETFDAWKKILSGYEEYLVDGQNSARTLITGEGIPVIDFISRHESVNLCPYEIIYTSANNRVIGETYDPTTSSLKIINIAVNGRGVTKSVVMPGNGAQSVNFIDLKSEWVSFVGTNSIDRDPTSGNFLFTVETSLKNEDLRPGQTAEPAAADPAYLFFSGNVPYILAKNDARGGSEYQTFPLNIADLASTDKISFLRRRVVQNDTAYNYIVILRKKARAEKTQVFAMVAAELGDGLRVRYLGTIYDGPAMSLREMRLRFQEHEGSVVFDAVTPVRGPQTYLKVEKDDENAPHFIDSTVPLKTVPYTLLGGAKANNQNQLYLRSINEVRLIPNSLDFREYDPTGATISATGFYMAVKGPSTDDSSASFIPGYPLYTFKDRATQSVTHLMQTKILESDPTPNAQAISSQVSLFPVSDRRLGNVKKKTANDDSSEPEEHQDDSDASRFRMGVAITPEQRFIANGWMTTLFVPYPYKSLAFSQIIQGVKSRSNEFHILMFFRANDEIKGSSDVVLSASGRVRVVHGNPDRFEVTLSEPQKLHRGPLPPSNVRAHLLVDAEGAFYWVDDPEIPKDSAKYRIRKLSNPDEIIGPRLGQLLLLREPDNIKDTEVGYSNDRFMHGGRWEIFGRQSLENQVAGLADYLNRKNKKNGGKKKKSDSAASEKSKDKDEKKGEGEEEGPIANDVDDTGVESRLFASFDRYLDDLIAKKDEAIKRPRVILVEPRLIERFKMAFFAKLSEGKGPFSIRNPQFNYFHANHSLDDVEVAEELRYLARPQGSKTYLLFVEPELFKTEITVRYSGAKEEEGDTETEHPQESTSEHELSLFSPHEAMEKASLSVLVATNGHAKSVKGFKKLKPSPNSNIPMLSIMTPAEWRAVQDVNEPERDAGVFDSFETDSDFLTSSWTQWPPDGEKASDDLKALTSVPYRAEEMRVFPTLEKILSDAAQGLLKGKQKIIIVPNELKALVQKLVMVRWASKDASAGIWNFSNPKLALQRINGRDSDQQSLIQDNYRSIRAASKTRNAVLYSDLSTIIDLGRPVNAKSNRNFQIRDPIRAGRNYLIESEAGVPPSEHQTPETSEGDEDFATADDVKAEIDIINLELDTLTEEYDSATRRAKLSGVGTRVKEIQDNIDRLRLVRQGLDAKLDEFETEDGTQSATKETHSVNDKSAYPHMLWWVAAEGQAVQPRKGQDWNLKNAIDHNIATILIGTAEELQRLESDLSFEGKFMDIHKQFEIETLAAPDEETKFNLVKQLFERPEVRSLGIEFKLKNENGLEPRSQLIYHFINRIEQVAYDQKIERTAAFIRSYIALKNSLTEDLDLRKDRQINERFIERLFTRVFPMPLNPEILEAHDPLNRLKNRDQAVRDLQATGYAGSQDLKRRVFETILSQTRPTDSSRPIPNSQILYGSTSTGKTFLLRSLFKMLDFVEYNPRKANNAEADYIFINVAKLTDDLKNSDPDKIHVDEAIAQIMDLMSQPKGPRAHIVFDDFHKASSKAVREKLSQFIQGLFEAENGMILVKSKDLKRGPREIPVQNLNIYMTLNPVFNEKVRSQFIKDSHRGAELLKREVLAALSGDGFNPEESVLARWSDIINLDQFPRSAKVPELVRRVRINASRSGQMVLVDPQVIDSLIDRFPSAHAREFLSPASSALTTLPPTAVRAPMYIVTLRDSLISPQGGATFPDGAVNPQELTAAVRGLTQIDPVQPNDPASLLRLSGFIMRNFRLQVFNHVSLEAHMSDTLRLNKPGMANLLKTNFILAFASHVMDKPRLPIGEMTLKPEQYSFFDRSKLEEFIRLQGEMKESTPYFPINMELQDRGEEMNLQNFIEGKWASSVQPRTRREVLTQTVFKLEAILTRAMQLYLRLESPTDVRTVGQWDTTKIQNWYQRLSEVDPEPEFRKIAQEILEAYFEFSDEFHSPDLVDLSLGKADFPLNLFDEVRLFAFAMDKAVLRLPWGQVSNFSLNVAMQSSDFSLGTRASFREYVGTHQLSPFTIATPEFMHDMYQTARTIGGIDLTDARVADLREHFGMLCETLLKGDAKANGEPQ